MEAPNTTGIHHLHIAKATNFFPDQRRDIKGHLANREIMHKHEKIAPIEINMHRILINSHSAKH
ncbi:UNVERIFIED_CONTAM: hypothetical protein Slati_0943100 [Sesamum latifolium]|uniref:Uncharacterized protein n=1 Tax=Sesamum latifolium TaxID=2727402 RepID=A0AAW2XQ54_9LAMI